MRSPRQSRYTGRNVQQVMESLHTREIYARVLLSVLRLSLVAVADRRLGSIMPSRKANVPSGRGSTGKLSYSSGLISEESSLDDGHPI